MKNLRQFPNFLRDFTSRSYFRNLLVAAVGFAVAGALGLMTGVLLLKSPLATGLVGLVDVAQPLQRVVAALVIFLVGMAVSGIVMGSVGGWILTVVDALAPRRRYIWTGAVAFAVPQAILVPLALLLASLLGVYYNNIDANPVHLPILFGIFGLFYGMLAGVIFGLLSVGLKYGWGVVFVSMMGGLVGGVLTGWLLRLTLERIGVTGLASHGWLALLIFMVFYAVMGLALGSVYTWFHRARKAGGDLPRYMGRYWRIFAIFAVAMVILNLAGTFYQVFSFAMMRPASTSTVLAPEASAPEQYTCPDTTGSPYGDAILHVLKTDPYRPPGSLIPFCQNQFLTLTFLPYPPETVTGAESPDSAFDEVADQIRSARYEVLFATMEWMKDEQMDSPGFILAQAVADLYDQVKAHPEAYPRGMTVRILLGNYPELATFTWGDQVWNVMDVLQKAGLPEMENPDLGWKVELANFDGQNPHSHAKFLIIDGEKVMAAGFNYSYLHYSRNHPSGLGVSLVDYGLLMRGPVAQDALAAFDDLWEGSNLVACPGLDPPKGDWARYCTELEGAAVATHVPEVTLYHPTTSDDVAFSLLRTYNRPESDRALDALLRSAQDRIDIFEVNFSLEVYCALGIVMDDFCSMQDSLDYMQALLDVMERNQVRIRVLTTDVNMNGIENSVAIETFQKELARRGLSHLAEFRFYDGRMHAKAFLVDDAFLVVGSQNFHYSAWGDDRGLVEYNLATDSEQAISEFQQAFEYYWQHSKPAIPGEVRSE